MGARELGSGRLGLTRTVRAHQRDVLAGPQRPFAQKHRVARGHGHEQICGECVLEGGRDVGSELLGDATRALVVDVPDADRAAAREKGARRGPAVHTGPDDCGRRSVATAERLRREHRRRARAERRDRRCVEHGPQLPVLGVRDEHDTGHGGQPVLRIAGKRRHPLEESMAAAQSRHRAKVAGGIVRHVDLRRHRPLALRVRDESVAHRLDRALRRHSLLDVPPREDGDPAHSALTAAVSRATDSFASPNSIIAFGSRKSGLSMPAKPGLIERFSTTTACDWSTFRIGMP
jgi:hypothetical protein